MDDLTELVSKMRQELNALKAESEARRLLARYMYLCDSPLPEYGMSDEDRVQAIGGLFTEDAIWEGVGGTHGAQFGQHIGPSQISAHMGRFYGARDPRQIFNTHYLCSEQLRATPEGAEGNWVQFQPWIYDDGSSVIRSSRLHVRFRPTAAGWKISRYRTESLFVGKLPNAWTSTQIDISVLMAPVG